MELKKLSAKFWIILGIALILFGFVLAHLSDANLIRWSYGLEHVASLVFHGGGPLLVVIGLIKFFVEKRRF